MGSLAPGISAGGPTGVDTAAPAVHKAVKNHTNNNWDFVRGLHDEPVCMRNILLCIYFSR